MSTHQVDEIGPYAARVLMDRWSLDARAANAALDDVADDLGVEVSDLAALVVAAASHLHLVVDVPAEPVNLEFGYRVFYGRRDRPWVEVRVDGAWLRGRLCNQIEGVDAWWLYVLHHRPGQRAARLGRFAAHGVRRVTVLPTDRPSNPGPDGPDEPPPDNPSGLEGSTAA